MKHRKKKTNNSNNASCIFKKQKRNKFWEHWLKSENEQKARINKNE